MSHFTVGWKVPANIGLLPQHPGDGQQPFFTIGWTVKQQATWYPWGADLRKVALDDAVVTVPPAGGGTDTPPATTTPTTTTPTTTTPTGGRDGVVAGDGPAGAGAGAVSGASSQVRPRIARANVAARKDPGLFRKKGLTFALSLEAPATVTAVLVTSSGRKLTYSQTRKVGAGVEHLTLRPSEYGKLATRRSKKVAAKLEITIRYADRSTGTVRKAMTLQAPPKKK